jgi:hypothetical protein
MIQNFSYSIKLNAAALFCFLLPFFYTGCESTTETATSDSTAVQVEEPPLPQNSITDTSSSLDSTKLASAKDTTTDTTAKQKDSTTTDPNNVAQIVSEKYPILAPLLVPKPDTFTGVAMVINDVVFFSYYALVLCFLLLLISLCIKFIEPQARKSILLVETIALIALMLSTPVSINSKTLWGYWVSLFVVLCLVAYDVYIVRTLVNSNTSGEQ